MEAVFSVGRIVKGAKLYRESYAAGYHHFLLDMGAYCPMDSLAEPDKERKKWDNLSDYLPDEPKKAVEATSFFRTECERLGVSIPIGRGFGYTQNPKCIPDLKLMKTVTEESIRACGEAGCRYMIQNPLELVLDSEEALETYKAFYLSLSTLVKRNQLMLLLRNDIVIKNGQAHRGNMADPYFLCKLVDEVNEMAGFELLGVCLDTGVCNMLGQLYYEVITMVGSRIKAVMLCENDGVKGARLMPFTTASGGIACMDWLNIFRGLRAIQFDGLVICDFSDTNTVIPPYMRPVLIEYEKKLTDYILWQLNLENVIRKYPTRVLFGAGNMCRNYMLCYGEEFPPLFTCDNNSNIWGQTFEGLEIKNPEELKNLPEDCAIFICNMYYNEIEKQLRDMGLKNPIERFNDEFLPFMYTDRFDGEKREVRK